MSFEVTTPTEGKVSVELNWREAEVLLRILEQTHYGDVEYRSPTLADLRLTLSEEFGFNDQGQCENYYSKINGGMVMIYDKIPF